MGHRSLRKGPQVHHREAGAGGSSDCKAGGKAVLAPCMHRGQCAPVQVLGTLHRDPLSLGTDPLQRTGPAAVADRRTEAAADKAALGLALGTDSAPSLGTLVVAVAQVHYGRSERMPRPSSPIEAVAATEAGPLVVGG